MVIANANRIWNRSLLNCNGISVGIVGMRGMRTSSPVDGPDRIAACTTMLLSNVFFTASRVPILRYNFQGQLLRLCHKILPNPQSTPRNKYLFLGPYEAGMLKVIEKKNGVDIGVLGQRSEMLSVEMILRDSRAAEGTLIIGPGRTKGKGWS